MKALKFVWRVLFCEHLWLAAFTAILLYGMLSGIGETRPETMWTWKHAISRALFLLTVLLCAHSAGRQWCRPRIRRLEEALKYSRADYRRMLDMNKTMIDDVLTAHHAGLPVKTFLHGCGMTTREAEDDRAAGA